MDEPRARRGRIAERFAGGGILAVGRGATHTWARVAGTGSLDVVVGVVLHMSQTEVSANGLLSNQAAVAAQPFGNAAGIGGPKLTAKRPRQSGCSRARILISMRLQDAIHSTYLAGPMSDQMIAGKGLGAS